MRVLRDADRAEGVRRRNVLRRGRRDPRAGARLERTSRSRSSEGPRSAPAMPSERPRPAATRDRGCAHRDRRSDRRLGRCDVGLPADGYCRRSTGVGARARDRRPSIGALRWPRHLGFPATRYRGTSAGADVGYPADTRSGDFGVADVVSRRESARIRVEPERQLRDLRSARRGRAGGQRHRRQRRGLPARVLSERRLRRVRLDPLVAQRDDQDWLRFRLRVPDVRGRCVGRARARGTRAKARRKRELPGVELRRTARRLRLRTRAPPLDSRGARGGRTSADTPRQRRSDSRNHPRGVFAERIVGQLRVGADGKRDRDLPDVRPRQFSKPARPRYWPCVGRFGESDLLPDPRSDRRHATPLRRRRRGDRTPARRASNRRPDDGNPARPRSLPRRPAAGALGGRKAR
jgi:hypothetical protein